jgi:hypothetical protein
MEERYSFFDLRSQTIIEHLNWTQAHSLCLILHKINYENFYYLSSKDNRWVPLDMEIENIINNKNNLLRSIPIPSDQLNEKTKLTHQLINAPTDRRSYARYNKSLVMTLDIEGFLKKVHTVDVSLNGLRITEILEAPKKNEFVMVFFKSPNAVLEFKAKPVLKYGFNFDSLQIISCNNLPHWKKVVEE